MAGESKIDVPVIVAEKSSSCNIRVYLRYIFHFVAAALFWFTFGAGLLTWKLFFTEDVDIKDPRILKVKWVPACYLTNWNLATLFFKTMAGESKIDVPVIVAEKSSSCNIRVYLRYIFHFVAAALFWFTFGAGLLTWKLFFTEDVDIKDPRILKVKWVPACYLTNWNLVFQICFLTMSLIYDILEWMDRHESMFGRLLRFCRDVLFSAVVVPTTMCIVIVFWIVYWFNRELVYPEVYDEVVPGWFNHSVHTNIVVVIALETLLQARRHPANLKVELWLVGIVAVAYAIVNYLIYFITNRWLYGLYGIMNLWQVCLYQIVTWISTYVFYAIQFPINRLFHREQASQVAIQKTDHQNNGKKSRFTTLLSDSWSLKFRSKSGCEDICL